MILSDNTDLGFEWTLVIYDKVTEGFKGTTVFTYIKAR